MISSYRNSPYNGGYDTHLHEGNLTYMYSDGTNSKSSCKVNWNVLSKAQIKFRY